jgi:hypothetical protein
MFGAVVATRQTTAAIERSRPITGITNLKVK